MKNRIWWNSFWNLFFPQNNFCLFCLENEQSAEYMGICQECCERILEISEKQTTCTYCGYFTAGEECPNCRSFNTNPLEVGAVVPYEGMFREIIHDLKYNGRKDLARPIGYLMARRIQRLRATRNIRAVVPVPLYAAREKERGYNQSLLLAEIIAEILKKPLWTELLAREHFHHPQMILSREERFQNVKGAFKYITGDNLSGKVILLVDDIITTGATLRACAQILREAGAEKVYGITWAAGYNIKLMEKIVGNWFYQRHKSY